MRKLLTHLNHFLRKSKKGQSMVEMAIMAPIAIFMMLGVFEVGWALRSYIVLVNANREATRFAIRPNYLDYSIKDVTTVGYEEVLTHANTSLSNQLDLDFETNSKLIISHIVVDTGSPFEPALPKEDPFTNWPKPLNTACDTINATNVYTYDDLVLHPNMPGWEYYAQSYPTGTITSTLFDFENKIDDWMLENNRFNCELMKKGGQTSVKNFIVTEIFYEQPQLFGFPLISNPFTDPVPLYTHTVMRLAPSARTNEVVDTVGPVCEAYPIIVHKDTVKFGTNEKLNQVVDIFDGNDSSDWGWLAWNPDEAVGSNTPYLRHELKNSRMSLNDYTNARDPGDNGLSVGDYVASIQGVKAAVESSDKLVSALVGKKIRIPVWDIFDKGTGGDRDAYHIIGFAWVRIIEESGIDLDGKTIEAVYLGDATNGCDGSTTGPGGGGPGGGGSTPTPTPTDDPGGGPTGTDTPTSTPTATPTPTNTPTATATTAAVSTPTPDSSQIYQAEEANVGGDSSVDSNHGGYNGSGFVNFPKKDGYVEYQNVDGGSGGSKTLQFRYALGAGNSRTGQITVNGLTQNITFDPSGGWSTWATKSVIVTLNSGASNTIRVESTGDDLANLDQMTVN